MKVKRWNVNRVRAVDVPRIDTPTVHGVLARTRSRRTLVRRADREGMLSPLLIDTPVATELGRLLLALVALAVVILLGRFVIDLAWKLVVVAAFYVASVAIPGFAIG